MIRNTFPLIVILLGIEILVMAVSAHVRFKRFFKFIPAVFWIYFLPMLFSAGGIIDPQSPVLQVLPAFLLPAALLLLLLSSDIAGIVRCGRPALIMMMAGSVGIMLAVPLVFFLCKGLVGEEFWSGFGVLSGSWIGGSANMIAVKEAIGTPERVFLPMVIVDTVVPYVWMGILVALAGMQSAFDRWNRCDRTIIDELAVRSLSASAAKQSCLRLDMLVVIFLVAFAGVAASRFLAGLLPEIHEMISRYAWTIIIASALGILLSLTAVKELERYGASKAGYFILYFVLTTVGAKAGVVNVGPVFVLILAGLAIVAIHALVLLLTARLIRAPLFLVAVASQANIGGVASAPIVATIYQPGLASIGLLLAILGNILGTYLGILIGQICRFIAA